jgi:hypothetical protein
MIWWHLDNHKKKNHRRPVFGCEGRRFENEPMRNKNTQEKHKKRQRDAVQYLHTPWIFCEESESDFRFLI